MVLGRTNALPNVKHVTLAKVNIVAFHRVESPESHKIDVGRVQHQFDSCQNQNGVAAQHDTCQADTE
jgi:hypothetical protein